jgi:Protein of unknown function (DUF4019)
MRGSAILLILAFCYSARALTLSADDAAARDAALQWLQVVDSGKYQDAGLQMSQEVRAVRDWRNYFAARRVPLGRLTKRQVAELKRGSTIPEIAGVREYRTIRFKTSFEHNPNAEEEVTMMKMGCCWEVCGYKINDN